MEKNKLQYLIWLVCFLILLQTGVIGFRLHQLKQKRLQLIQEQEEQKLAVQKQAQEELKEVAEPAIKEKLPHGGKLWLEPDETVFEGELKLNIWGETDQLVKEIDLKLFYPNDILEVLDDDWVTDGGSASWSGSLKSFNSGKKKITSIVFQPKNLDSGEVKDILIDFDFLKESLLDCNLINEKGEDVLEEVRGAKVNLKI